MEKEIKTRYYIAMVVLCALFFACGYKYGDSRGFLAGYNEGYRFDCKDEIFTLYEQVKATSKALNYTDSSMKKILHENDSLKRKEYYQKRHDDSVRIWNQYSIDSVKYHVVARKYADSLNKAVGGYVGNIIQDNGRVNPICVLFDFYKNLPECQDGFNLRVKLDKMIKKTKRGKK